MFKILVVEDDRNIADLLRLYLEKEGYQVFLADEEDVDFNFETEVADPEFSILGATMFAVRDQLWLQVMACDEKANCGPFAKERLTVKACD